MVFRNGTLNDVERIANLHAVSWQQNYRESFSADFLDKKAHADRLHIWQGRFANFSKNQYLLLSEEEGKLLGFICAFFNQDKMFGTYLDNLHVASNAQGKGVGTKLMVALAKEIQRRNNEMGFYLWVLKTNKSAISFYERLGGSAIETIEADDIGDTTFFKIRYVWKDVNILLNLLKVKNTTEE
jgi:ribosomal protein S18 acetylase RimI-like enzyme